MSAASGNTAFEGRRAVVTGGTRGLGAAISRALLASGAQVHATYRSDEDGARAFADACGADAERLSLARFDVADPSQVEDFWSQHDEPVDVLVNNAGIRRDRVVAMMSGEEWEQVLATNLSGGFHMAKQAVLNMMRSRYGRIIFVTSPAGRFGFEGQGNYSASKAGQVGLARSLSKEVAKRGITVNCVSPGFVETELIGDLPPEALAEHKRSVPMRRFGTPEEVAHAVLFLAGEQAAYITGATLEVTGGL